MDKFKDKYRISSARVRWHDYDGGAYFVTICTKNKEHFCGCIKNGKMYLSNIGKCILENIQNVDKHYPYAEIPLFVIMPNHIHVIVFIDNLHCNKDVARDWRGDVARNVSTTTTISPKRGTLPVVIRGIKSATTKFANENKLKFGWQTRYHDHIIRGTDDMNRIADYIENNVACWESDCFFTP